MSGAEDTETLLALISSLLSAPVHDQSVLLDALVECDGSVERAAKFLNSRAATSSRALPSRTTSSTKATGMKRKSAGLEGWLGKPSPSLASDADLQRTKRSRSGQAVTSAKSQAQAVPSPSSSKAESSVRKSEPIMIDDDDDVLPSLLVDKTVSSAKPQSSSGPLPSENKSPVKVKNVTNAEFMSILRPPNSSDNSSKSGPPKQPPLTLTTPEMIAKHVPCTMHTSVLPPDLACR